MTNPENAIDMPDAMDEKRQAALDAFEKMVKQLLYPHGEQLTPMDYQGAGFILAHDILEKGLGHTIRSALLGK